MNGYYKNIEEATIANKNFRDVVYTGDYLQLVYMRLKPGECIGTEVHGNDQFFRFEKGTGMVRLDDNEYKVTDGHGVVVPAGATHNVTNTSSVDDLLFYTIYAAPHHLDGMKYQSKEAAVKNDKPYDGKPTE